MKRNDHDVDVGRRDLLKTIGAGAAGTVAASLAGGAFARDASAGGRANTVPGTSPAAPYNIFILTDQGRHFRSGELPHGYRLPAHERLAKCGIVFENHRINSCVCTPRRSTTVRSRSTICSG